MTPIRINGIRRPRKILEIKSQLTVAHKLLHVAAMNFRIALASLFVVATTSCGSSPPSAQDEGGTVDAEEEMLSANANFGYFTVTRRDMRRCMFPICGGYYVKRVNQETTRCVDGKLAA